MAEKIVIDGMTYDWGQLLSRFRQIKERFPRAMARTAHSFFIDSFRRQGWYDGRTLRRWPPRKKRQKGRRRALLIKSGRLRRSIRIRRATFAEILIAAEAPYAAANNFGYRGRVTVRRHTRHRYNAVREKYTTRTGKERTRSHKVTASSYTVRAHTRRMDLPQRQFMGQNAMLDRKLRATVDAALKVVFQN